MCWPAWPTNKLGNGVSLAPGGAGASALSQEEGEELTKRTHFSVEEVHALHHHFMRLASSEIDDRLIDANEFRQALGLGKGMFMERMFQLFDENGDGNINFTEFICGLSILSTRGTQEEKTVLSFRMFSSTKDSKGIDRSSLRAMLEATMADSGVGVTSDMVGGIVDATFEECDLDKNDMIDLEEYRNMVAANPAILGNMTLDFQKMQKRQESETVQGA